MKMPLALLAAMLLTLSAASAQNRDSVVKAKSQLEVIYTDPAIEITQIQLPPLHVLTENARRLSPQVNFYAANKEIEERELKTVRRTWLRYIKLNASYSYGSNDIVSEQFYNNQYPVVRNVSGSTQSWWNVGANISLPLEEIFNRGNKNKQQKKKIESIQYEVDRWHDDICLKIIESYTSAQQYMSMLKSASETMVISQAQFQLSKNDFMNGHIDARELSRQKTIEYTAIREYEMIRSSLNKALLQLETLAKTRIITPEEYFKID